MGIYSPKLLCTTEVESSIIKQVSFYSSQKGDVGA
jgi:hypothetical protein